MYGGVTVGLIKATGWLYFTSGGRIEFTNVDHVMQGCDS